jgi:ATP-binding cassette subfamily B protein
LLANFRHLLGYTRPYRRAYVAGTLALLVVNFLDTFTPKITQWGIDHVVQSVAGRPVESPLLRVLPDAWFPATSPGSGLWVYALAMALVVATTGAFRYVMSISYARAGVNLIHDLRGRFFGHVQRLDAAWHDHQKTGDHMSLATNDTEAARMFFTIGLLLLFDTAFYFIMVPAYMLTISVPLTLMSVVTLPLIPLVVMRLTGTAERRFEAVQEQFASLSERARESYSGARVIKSFAREEAEVRSFAKLCRAYVSKSLRFQKLAAVQGPVLALLLGLADLVVVVYGGTLVLRGEISVGQFAAFFQYLIRLSGPMIGLGWTITLYQRGRVGLSRIEEVLDTLPAIVEPEEPAVLADIAGRIEIRDLTFAYPGAPTPALAGLSVTVRAGGTLGIVGPVGSGKSTLLALIPRLYDPPPGTVFIDGEDIRRIPLGLLRSRVGAVPQDTFLFSETVRENIASGWPGETPPPGRVEACAEIAGIAGEAATLPRGFDTLLGERGVNLSGGQKQRVAIARALARDPAILLLDDCLSSVDTETEARILGNLREAKRGRTTLIVSHRVATVMDADEILVLRDGRVAERGRHADLVRLGGTYAEIWRKQSSGEEAR